MVRHWCYLVVEDMDDFIMKFMPISTRTFLYCGYSMVRLKQIDKCRARIVLNNPEDPEKTVYFLTIYVEFEYEEDYDEMVEIVSKGYDEDVMIWI